MKRPWHIWIAFGLAAAVLFGGMAWVSVTALRLERQATREENVRLALWRMDSGLAPLLAQENARPYFAYRAFYPAEAAYTRLFRKVRHGDVLVPSPLLTQASPYVLLHFQFAPGGELTSPQVPTGNMRDLAEVGYTTHEAVEANAEQLRRLEQLVSRADLLAALPKLKGGPAPGRSLRPTSEQQPTDRAPQEPTRRDWQARFQRTMEANTMAQTQSGDQTESPTEGSPSKVTGELMRPVWAGDELLLARRVLVNGGDYVQGCWLDWSAIRAWLLEDVRDLLPGARLERVGRRAGARPARMLAGLPVRLVPGQAGARAGQTMSPIRLSLLIAWTCVVLAGVAVAVVLSAVVSLSERRAAFVSAVTHEMRTPLTTFQMYTEMLADGMVTDEAKRHRYLTTLRAEAQRLGHLVENVLAYARLERGPKPRRMATVAVPTLIESLRDRLTERALQAGMTFAIETEEDLPVVRADASAVERILFNLVDNACKYASVADDKTIHLRVERNGGFAVLRLRDHGPGIADDELGRLFRPFSKSAHQAAHSAPGIGLGLALSRRLARRMGGDLRLDQSTRDGACFVLTLPASAAG